MILLRAYIPSERDWQLDDPNLSWNYLIFLSRTLRKSNNVASINSFESSVKDTITRYNSQYLYLFLKLSLKLSKIHETTFLFCRQKEKLEI